MVAEKHQVSVSFQMPATALSPSCQSLVLITYLKCLFQVHATSVTALSAS